MGYAAVIRKLFATLCVLSLISAVGDTQLVWAQGSTNRLIAGQGISISGNTISATQAVNATIQNSGAAITSNLAGQTVLLGAFTYTLAQAGSTGFPANWGTCLLNNSTTGNATINATTSIFAGATYTAQMILAPGGWACPTSDGANYQTAAERGNPTIQNSSTTYTFTLADCGTTQRFTATTAIAVTLPNSFYPSCSIDIIQGAAGVPTFSAQSGGALISFDNYVKTAGQGAGVTLRVGLNTGGAAAQWYLFGRGA